MLTLYSDKINGAYKVKMLPIILMNKKYKNDKGLHKHELEHVKQYLFWFVLTGVPLFFLFNWFIALCVAITAHDVLYTVVKKYRQWCEVKAFRKQLSYDGSIDLAAKHLSKDYNLDISFEKAKELLS